MMLAHAVRTGVGPGRIIIIISSSSSSSTIGNYAGFHQGGEGLRGREIRHKTSCDSNFSYEDRRDRQEKSELGLL